MSESDRILRFSYPTHRRDLEDRVERVLFLSGSRGSAIEEAGDRTVIRLWFDTEEQRAAAAAMVPEGDADLEVGVEDSASVDWLEYYEHSLEPIEIGQRWVVVPDARLVPAGSDRIPVVIPQERAFGTGSHETTALCLAMMEKLDLEGASVADVGTGSGILAIAMAKLGAGSVVAFDNDVETWGIVRENMARNDVPSDAILVYFGSVEALGDGARFDLVTMNIIPEVILPALPEVAERVKPGGRIIFSGILNDRAPMVIEAAGRNSLRLVEEASRGEWWCGLFGREAATG